MRKYVEKYGIISHISYTDGHNILFNKCVQTIYLQPKHFVHG